MECGVTRRTIFRDLEALRRAGLPLQYDEALQQYRLPATRLLPPTNLTAEETLSLLVLCYELGDRARMPFYAPACSAALKLESSLPGRLREEVREVTSAINIRLQPGNPLKDHETAYQQLVRAIADKRCVRMRYDSLTEWEEIGTKLSPYRMLFSRRSWYVIGRSSLHRATRTFNVGRIAKLETLDETFLAKKGFSLDRYLRNAWHLIPEPGPDVEVRLKFQPMVARNVAEVIWHKTQHTRMNKDGALNFRVTVSGLWEISWWILGYGDQVEVIAPKKLRGMIAQRARGMLAQYENGRAPKATSGRRRGTRRKNPK